MYVQLFACQVNDETIEINLVDHEHRTNRLYSTIDRQVIFSENKITRLVYDLFFS
jgi:hypothetical protein